jgi:16S rRNA (adenine(1408)-N(1))-methyltransferase
MLRQISGKQIKELSAEKFMDLRGKFATCVIDLGTGDGKFAYEYAASHPDTLVIGIDADKQQAEDISYKASRKPAKGGLENVIFIWAKAEELPLELADIADEIYVNFPWGNLLSGVMLADVQMLSEIKRVAKPDAKFHLYVSYDAKFEEEKMAELELPLLSLNFLRNVLTKKYLDLGFMIQDLRIISAEDKQNLLSSWPKRILSKRDRDVYYIEAEIEKETNDVVDVEPRGTTVSTYSFFVYGHPNIRATHFKTLEFTKDTELTERGDCIIGIKADFDIARLKQFQKKIRIICEIEHEGRVLRSEFKSKVHPGFNDDHEMVLRKSGFPSERTFGIGLNLGANHLDREMVKLLQDPNTKMKVTIKSEN